MNTAQPAVLTKIGFQALIDTLRKRGYRTLGPTVRDGAIVYDDVGSLADLPRGWTDEQGALPAPPPRGRGAVRLCGRAAFGKKFLHPPRQLLWTAERTEQGMHVRSERPSDERFAFIGVRACDLNAILIQDRVLSGGAQVDPNYRARRDGLFVIAVNCGVAGGTCFCASMHMGPKAADGYDLALTELIGNGEHRFVVAIGSNAGQTLLAELPHRPATDEEIAEADAVVARTAASMGREMGADDVHDLLLRNLDHPRWDEVAGRCLTCGNCTMVCPTCFCTTVEEASDLTGSRTSRSQRRDSCFTMDFSYIHGGSVRSSGRSRYPQWMTHKLATWWDQFGTTGCVGCGRRITWCPVGIDITEEVAAIRVSEPQ